MLAVVEIGKKQYLVEKGLTLEVEKLQGEKESKISFDKVLLLASDKKVKIGTPYLEKARVEARIEGEKKGKKVTVYKVKRRKKYRRKKGHRQNYTVLKINRIIESSNQSSKE
ncbi:MAG: 50S ribosomal protein L21 [Candidatus Omnitrophica bacterium]|nr:50S ribosomal protein L21 [Candidatus Omnitrophota bacterium]MBD3268731.1 50S ribosomal protein L21 [Candidatus Omnitrophota bacterium]